MVVLGGRRFLMGEIPYLYCVSGCGGQGDCGPWVALGNKSPKIDTLTLLTPHPFTGLPNLVDSPGLQGYHAHEKGHPPPEDHHKALDVVLL